MSAPRILAIDLRSQLFGFSVLEDPRTLLDCGRKPFRLSNPRPEATIVRKKIASLLTLFAPSAIIVKHTLGRNDREVMRRKEVIAAIQKEAYMHAVELVFLTRKEIYQAFRQSCNTNKYKIAGLVAETFPELLSRLPPYRKNWEPEHHNMAIFDAISAGLAYFAQIDGLVETADFQVPEVD
jgi:hypothetical protein